MNNLGAQAASAELLVFLNDDVTPLRPEWLDVMAGHLLRPEIGIAGGCCGIRRERFSMRVLCWECKMVLGIRDAVPIVRI